VRVCGGFRSFGNFLFIIDWLFLVANRNPKMMHFEGYGKESMKWDGMLMIPTCKGSLQSFCDFLDKLSYHLIK
jgi:hypothetical protein